MFAFASIIGLLAVMILVPLGLFLMVFWIWMLVDAIRNRALSDGEKIGWVLAIIFFHFLGSLLYFFIGRQRA